MLEKIKENIKNWAVKEIFNRYYKFYNYPFEKSSELFDKMSPDEQKQYLYDIKFMLRSKALTTEIEELKRSIFEDLATKTNSESGIAGFRLCLIFIKKFEQRLKALSDKSDLDEEMEKINKI